MVFMTRTPPFSRVVITMVLLKTFGSFFIMRYGLFDFSAFWLTILEFYYYWNLEGSTRTKLDMGIPMVQSKLKNNSLKRIFYFIWSLDVVVVKCYKGVVSELKFGFGKLWWDLPPLNRPLGFRLCNKIRH
jgi:hypothetical protein